MHLINIKRKERKRLQYRRIQLLEGYRIVQGMRIKREIHLNQTEHAIQHYEQRYTQANRRYQIIRSNMFRSTRMMERLCQSNTWVTAPEHERLYNNSQKWVNKLCEVRFMQSQYQQDILKLRQQVEDSTARLIGLDRALATLIQELHDIHYALMPLTNSANNQHYQYQSPRIYPSQFPVKYNLLD